MTASRQPKGTPTGGQFLASTRAEAAVTLIADLNEKFAGDDPGYQWSTEPMPRSHIGPTCPECQTIHGADAAVAVGRFDPDGPRGYRSRLGGPLRPARDEAVADYCAAHQQTPTGTERTDP
jgi:hypothetical protein